MDEVTSVLNLVDVVSGTGLAQCISMRMQKYHTHLILSIFLHRQPRFQMSSAILPYPVPALLLICICISLFNILNHQDTVPMKEQILLPFLFEEGVLVEKLKEVAGMRAVKAITFVQLRTRP